MAGVGFSSDVEALTPAMAGALARLDEVERLTSEIGTNGQTLSCLVERGLADCHKPTSGRARPNAYRITEHGKAVLEELLKPCPYRRITVHDIQEAMAAFYKLEPIEMVSERRGREVAWPRQEAMFLARKLTPLSLPRIGQLFGNRDHTTVMHALAAVEKRITGDVGRTREALAEVEGRVSE